MSLLIAILQQGNPITNYCNIVTNDFRLCLRNMCSENLLTRAIQCLAYASKPCDTTLSSHDYGGAGPCSGRFGLLPKTPTPTTGTIF